MFLSSKGKPYTLSGLRSILRQKGIKTTYSLRHTRAQTMLDSGYDVADVAAWLGHADLRTVQVYAQVRSRRLKKLAESLDVPQSNQPRGDNLPASAEPQPLRRAKPRRSRGKSGKARKRTA